MQLPDDNQPRFLAITGVLYADNRVQLSNAHHALTIKSPRPALKSPVTAEIYDGKGKLLLRYPVAARSLCLFEKPHGDLALAGRIPLPDEAHKLRIIRDGIVLRELPCSARAIHLRLKWKTPKEVKGKEIVTWECSHQDGLEVSYTVRFSNNNGRSWTPLCFPILEKFLELNTGNLAAGSACLLEVTAADAMTAVCVRSPRFSVPNPGRPRGI